MEPDLQAGMREKEMLVVLLTIIVLGSLYFYNPDGWLIDDDEGSFLYQAWRISEGERPYADFFSSRDPLFLYSTGMLVKLMGRSILAIRAVPVLLSLVSSVIVYLLARRFLSAEGAWLAILAFLLHPQVFFYGRRLYPEPFMLLFIVLGLYLFQRGWDERRYWLLAGAGLSFGIATIYKLLGGLSLGGCLLWTIIEARQQRTGWRSWIVRTAAVLVPFGLLVGSSFLGFMYWEPAFYPSVIGVNLAQGRGLSGGHVLVKGMAFLLGYVLLYLPLMVFALPAAWASRRGSERISLIAWQLPTTLAFFLLHRDLFLRHLLYLAPSLAILFALALEPLRRWSGRSFLLVAVIGAVLLPWTLENTMQAMRTENDTAHIVELIRNQTDAEARIISDYQELNFHAARRSTYLGAEISQVVVEGQERITGAQLIGEMEKDRVQMVILDVSPETAHHFVNLTDYEQFYSYIQENLALLGRFPRAGQVLEIYIK
ncbi:MAG: glycosyltransferase family 39 protein [Anaerolineae bacterium]|jgi:4-amino-4-deoxy-L-arabinose transferase-like glycosyltransferase|nr:glycosyltransferase family 39 protein [Anaerolineae bacterium]MDH7472448.1 glycosyltransferase family 39 protein [Anaerolineae bacterium]